MYLSIIFPFCSLSLPLFNIYPDDALRKWKEDIYFGIKLGRSLILNYVAYGDDLLIIQYTEDGLQKSIFKLQEIGKDCNVQISVNKTKTMALIGKYSV
jgi:hypothetical protein